MVFFFYDISGRSRNYDGAALMQNRTSVAESLILSTYLQVAIDFLPLYASSDRSVPIHGEFRIIRVTFQSNRVDSAN